VVHVASGWDGAFRRQGNEPCARISGWRYRKPVTFNQDLRGLVPREGIDGRYLARFLEASEASILGVVDEASHGTKRLTSERFENFEVPVPPLIEQRRIADLLDRAEALRAKRRVALAQVDTLAQAIFIDLFGDPSTNPKVWPVKRLDELCPSVTDIDHKMPVAVDDGLPMISAKRPDRGWPNFV
jgi:type I restriction enzyme S subunit